MGMSRMAQKTARGLGLRQEGRNREAFIGVGREKRWTLQRPVFLRRKSIRSGLFLGDAAGGVAPDWVLGAVDGEGPGDAVGVGGGAVAELEVPCAGTGGGADGLPEGWAGVVGVFEVAF